MTDPHAALRNAIERQREASAKAYREAQRWFPPKSPRYELTPRTCASVTERQETA